MSSFHGQHNNSRIFLEVAVLSAEAVQQTEALKRCPADHIFKALVDTGATTTCVTAEVTEKIGLPFTGREEVSGVGGLIELDSCFFKIGFPSPATAEDQQTQTRKVSLLGGEIHGYELVADHDFDVLLGMDIISAGSLKIESDGTFSFSF